MKFVSLGTALFVLIGVRAATADIIVQTDVLVGGGEGPGGVAVYRLPGLAVGNDGSMLVFAEGRHNGQDPGHPGTPISLVMKRSTDRGATWGPLVELHKDPAFDYSDPRAFVDQATGKIQVLYTQWPDGFDTSNIPPGLGADSAQMFLQTSNDNGVTWSGPVNITPQVKDPRWGVLDNAPGTGIQLQFQSDASRNGRLLSPPWRGEGNASNNLAIYSDDGGGTWQSGQGVTPTPGSEATIVELTDGRLLMDIRREGGALRLRTISNDGGETWGEGFPSDVPVTAVHASLTRYSAQRNRQTRDRILFAAPLGDPPGSGSSRTNIGIWTSYDEGKSFINPVEMVHGYGGYSAIHRLDDGTIGLFYETVGGTAIQYLNFDLAELEGIAHQAAVTHYDGFNNSVNRRRGGVGWSGAWNGNGHAVDSAEPAFGGSRDVPFAGFRFAQLPGRMDFIAGEANEASRDLAGMISLDHDQTSYVSLLVSRKLDNTADEATDEFLRVELRDSHDTPQATFGINNDESFFVGGLGADVSTPADTLSLVQSYFLVAKITSFSQGDGNFDQISLKVFESGDAIPDSDARLAWSIVGKTNENSSAVLQRIALAGGSRATWSIDDIRIGSTFGSVASNSAGEGVTEHVPQ